MYKHRQTLKKYFARAFSVLNTKLNNKFAVLTYHSVGSSNIASISTDNFEKHIKLLIRNNYHAIDWKYRHSTKDIKKRYLITFDDGYQDNYQYALPILEKYNIKAIFFITTAFINNEKDITKDFASYSGLAPMSWSEISDLVTCGHTVGLHGHTHQDFSKMSSDESLKEMEISSHIIYEKLGINSDCFAYPFGQIHHRRPDFLANKAVPALKNIFTTDNKLASSFDQALKGENALIPRIRIDALDDEVILLQKIKGSWDYIYLIQKLKSAMKLHSLTPILKVDR